MYSFHASACAAHAAALPLAEVERIEAYVFTCADCAGRLAESDAIRRAIADLMRLGRLRALVVVARSGPTTVALLAKTGEEVEKVLAEYVFDHAGSLDRTNQR